MIYNAVLKMDTKKKQALQKILEALVPYWDMAEGFLVLVNENEDENLLDVLYHTIYNEIKNINNENNINSIKTILKKIKEDQENTTESDYLENLINNI